MGPLQGAEESHIDKMPEDEKLIMKVLSGDTDAFYDIVERYKARVFTLAYSMLSCREEAEDVSQEAFVKIFRTLKMYDSSRSKFSTWVYRITYNLCVDHMRKRRETAPLDENMPVASSKAPEELILVADRDRMLREAVNNLPEEYRIPLVLFHFQGLSYREICGVLNVPISIVKNRLFRARKMLKEKLGGGASSEV